MKRLLNLAGIAIGVAGLAFVVARVARDRDEIADALADARPGGLLIAFVAGLAAMTLLGANWLVILRDGGVRAPWRRGLAWFFVGQLGKYVPGGIWPIVGQSELATRDGATRTVAYRSTALSMVATLLGAVAVAALAGLIAPSGTRTVPALLAMGLIVTMGSLAIAPIRRHLHRLSDRVTSRELRLPDGAWFAGIVARYVPMWVLYSVMTVGSAHALGASLDAELAVTLIYAACLSWMAGFVIIGLPGGLGVREAVLISMLTGPLGAGVAVSTALISRIVSIGVDLAGAALAVAIARSAPPMDDDEADAPARYAAP